MTLRDDVGANHRITGEWPILNFPTCGGPILITDARHSRMVELTSRKRGLTSRVIDAVEQFRKAINESEQQRQQKP